MKEGLGCEPDQGRRSSADEQLVCVRLGLGDASERWGLSSRGQGAGSHEEMTTHCVQRDKRGHAGPREPEKRGVLVRIQGDHAGKDTLNITRSLRAGPIRQGKNR